MIGCVSCLLKKLETVASMLLCKAVSTLPVLLPFNITAESSRADRVAEEQ